MSTTGARQIPEWTFGDRVRKSREMAGLTQTELAGRMGVSRKTISNYEDGHTQPQRPLDFAERLAEIADVPTAWVLFGDSEGMSSGRELVLAGHSI